MKKKLKKIVTLLTALCMSLCVSSVAFAAENTTTIDAGVTSSADTGTITISGVEEGLTVNAYKIAKAVYDDKVGEFTGYEMLYNATGFTIDKYGECTWENGDPTESDLSALFTAAQQNGVTASSTAGADGTATFESLEVGAYLFVVTGSESTVYGMVIGSVYYTTDEDGNWAISNGSVDVEGENLWVKSSTPHVTKEEIGGSIGNDGWTHGGSADLGDTLTYHITVGPIPAYEGEYPEFYVQDTISDELTISDEELNNLTVTIEDTTLVENTDYTVTRTTDGFIVNFVVNGKYTLNSYTGLSLVIEYSADVTSANNDADSADDDDHLNTVDLIYATTSYVLNVNGEHYEGTEEDVDHDYTFNAKIQKEDQDGEALSGATFTLYTDENCETEYTQSGSTVTATSGDDGYFEFTGLEEGTYYMKETVAPAGYALNTDIYKIVIAAKYKEDGALDAYTVTMYSPDEEGSFDSGANASVKNSQAVVKNVKLGTLPSMGARGTMTLTICGCVVVLGAAIAVVMNRRRKEVNG